MGFLKIKGPAAWSLVRTQPGPLIMYTDKAIWPMTNDLAKVFFKQNGY